MTLLQFIQKWKVNNSLLASKLGMTRGAFHNKINPNHETEFTDKEKIKLKEVLRELYTDLDTVTDIEFNEVLAAIVS